MRADASEHADFCPSPRLASDGMNVHPGSTRIPTASFIKEHIIWCAGLSFTAFAVLRVLYFAHFDLTTALTVVRFISPVNLLSNALLSILPASMLALGTAIIASRSRMPHLWRKLPGGVAVATGCMFAIVGALGISLEELVLGTAALAVAGLVTAVRFWDLHARRSGDSEEVPKVDGKPGAAVRSGMLCVAGVVLFTFSASFGAPSLPLSEVTTTPDHRMGYVLGESNGYTLFMESGRHAEVFPYKTGEAVFLPCDESHWYQRTFGTLALGTPNWRCGVGAKLTVSFVVQNGPGTDLSIGPASANVN